MDLSLLCLGYYRAQILYFQTELKLVILELLVISSLKNSMTVQRWAYFRDLVDLQQEIQFHLQLPLWGLSPNAS